MIGGSFFSHRNIISSSDEEIPKCERLSDKHEPHPCEPLDLSIRVTLAPLKSTVTHSICFTRDASSHSGGPSLISLPVSEGSLSDCKTVGPSALPCPVNHPYLLSNIFNQESTQGHQQTK
ncbi:hypothetical protein NPIL_234601, partial [Nephila pilipes]